MKSLIVALLSTLAVVSSSAAADSKDDIVTAEKNSWKAFANQDAKAYGDTMTDDAVVAAADGNVMTGKQRITGDFSSNPCSVKNFDLADTKVRQLSADIAILTYTLTQDVTCSGQKLAPKVFATSIYVRQGGKWRWANYQETALK